uniref:Plant heme peroxidase family profile domain-containing protein n=1 Tax=Oryza rufipogon TaxID=4529 RepID=A0A0E0PMT3_ORYRU
MACGPAVCSTSVLTPLRHRLLPLGNYNSNNVAALDVGSEYGFDTSYYANRTVRARVRRHAPLAKTLPKLIQLKGNQTQSTSSFANAMVKMGNLRGGYPGEVCDNCRRVRT